MCLNISRRSKVEIFYHIDGEIQTGLGIISKKHFLDGIKPWEAFLSGEERGQAWLASGLCGCRGSVFPQGSLLSGCRYQSFLSLEAILI